MGRVLLPFEYFEPKTVSEAIELINEQSGTLLMGGCTLVPALRRRQRKEKALISLQKVEGLDSFSIHPKTGMSLGAKICPSALSTNIWAGKRFAALHEACEQLYPPHIANMGSIVGNICSAVPYFDLPTAAMALDMQIHIAGKDGHRSVAIQDFYKAKYQVNLKQDELVTHVHCPAPVPDSGSAFGKIYRSRRTAEDLHKINAAVSICLDEERKSITDARVVTGSWNDFPQRHVAVETLLIGKTPGMDIFEEASNLVLSDLSPLTNLEWVEKTRASQCKVLVRDTIAQASSRAKSRHDPFDDAAEILENAI